MVMHEILEDFVAVKEVSAELINKYEKILPKEIIMLWKEKGFGIFYS